MHIKSSVKNILPTRTARKFISLLLVTALLSGLLTGLPPAAFAAQTKSTAQGKGNAFAQSVSQSAIYVALGDSVPAGYGLTDPQDCNVNQFSKLLSDNGCPNTLYNYSVSGITTDDLQKRLLDLSSAEPEVYQTIKNASVVTVNIGGNNVLGPLVEAVNQKMKQQFETLGITNIKSATQAQLISVAVALSQMTLTVEEMSKIEQGAASFRDDFPKIIKWLKTNAPHAKIIADTIYNPIPSYLNFYKTSEEKLNKMNTFIIENAGKSGYETADIYASFRAEQAKGTQILNLNLGQFKNTPLSVDIHPNSAGHTLIARVYYQCYQSITDAKKKDAQNANSDVIPKEYTGKIVIQKDKLSLEQGESYPLKVKLTKENTSGKKIVYKSSNKNILTVSQQGVMKAVHYGSATVTVSLGKAKVICRVTVTKNITITISAAGDCTFSSDIKQPAGNNFYSVYNKNRSTYFFQNVKPIFEKDDLTIVNFEGTLSNRGSRADKKWAFRGKPSYIKLLTQSSIEAVAFANNHCKDYGEISYRDTIDSFQKAGIAYSSYTTTDIYKVKGIKIGMVSVQEVGRSDAAAILRRALKNVNKKKPDLLIVSFHWGIERTKSATRAQKELSRIAINEGGADLVLGHHPHVLQPIEKYKNSFIVYSLGNFCFGGNTNPPDKDTMIYQQTFTFRNDKLVLDNNAQIIPCSVSSTRSKNDFQPTPSKGSEKKRILKRMNGYCKQYGISFDHNGKIINKK